MAQVTKIRPTGQLSPAPRPRTRKGTRSTVSSIATLARWQLRQTWRLLIVTGLGLLAAVVLIGMIPLYAQVSQSAGLRHALAADPQGGYFEVHTENHLFDTSITEDAQGRLTQYVHDALGSNVHSTPDRSVQIPTLNITKDTFVRLVGSDVSNAAGHVKLVQGRLPEQSSPDVLEFAATTHARDDFHFQLGKDIQIPYPLTDQNGRVIKHTLTLRMVGVFQELDGSDPFWHGETFGPEIFSRGIDTFERFPLLISNAEIMHELTTFSAGAIQADSTNNPQFATNAETFWYYTFDFSQVDINHLPDLSNNLNSLLGIINHHPEALPYITNTTSFGPLSALKSYGNRVTVVALPILGLTFMIGALVLFFVVLMIDLLVERQVTAITLLRSRGASGRQIFGSLLWQSLGLGLIAFVVGPLLAILLVVVLAQFTLQPADRAALGLITSDPLNVARGLVQRDLIVVGLALLAMIFSTWRVMRSNILLLRRETARATQQPFWIRLKLDVLAAIIALAGFGFTLYIASPGVLDAKTRALILPLTALIGLLALLVGALLLFLRFFPEVLRFGERMAARNRGAAPVLALAQMARSPRQSLRMTLLFALAVAFSLFTLIFSETQMQRLPDLTNYQVGGDISGQIPLNLESLPLQQQRDFFLHIKGVTSVSLVANQQVAGKSDGSVLVDLQAVDINSYASTVYWSEQDGSQPLSKLTNMLAVQRAAAVKKNIIPAIIDDTAAQSLNVTTGQQFVLKDTHGPITYVVAAVVHYLPTIYDTTSSTGDDSFIAHGGVLVDLSTASAVSQAVNSVDFTPDAIMIRTSDSPADLAKVRSQLFKGTYALGIPQDRREILASVGTDPLSEAIIGTLEIGAAVALLLALLGNLLVSWVNARSRKTSFAVMRALGCAPRQIVSVLFWEQGIVYTTALALGGLLSVLFALIILPAFVFSPLAAGSTGANSAQAFYLVQNVPPIHIIVPIWPVVGLLAGLVAICVIALWMMVRVVTRPRMSQELRVDED